MKNTLVSLLRSALKAGGEATISEKHGAKLLLACAARSQLRWIKHLLGCLLHLSLGRHERCSCLGVLQCGVQLDESS